MSEPWEAWEAHCRREEEWLASRMCGECARWRQVPEWVGDPDWGLCLDDGEWMRGDASVGETGCGSWKPRW